MEADVRAALAHDRTIDITTTGRRSGLPRRIETWFYNVDGRIYLSGSPGRRDWYANLRADPRLVFHLKESIRADLPARARLITDADERREAVAGIFAALGKLGDPEEWVARSPIAEVAFEDGSASARPR
jgi:deazaflavin-dependent oxidoreductase (nitroreductase family)